jgi:hypothetical protein
VSRELPPSTEGVINRPSPRANIVGVVDRKNLVNDDLGLSMVGTMSQKATFINTRPMSCISNVTAPPFLTKFPSLISTVFSPSILSKAFTNSTPKSIPIAKGAL